MTPVAIAIDVGGTKIAGALVTRDGVILSERTVPTPRGDRGADPDGTITSELAEYLASRARDSGQQIVAAGIGVPEYVSPRGHLTSAEVLDWRSGHATVRLVGVQVVIDSDVRCAARAERHLGVGCDLASFLFVSIGTGISHTLMIGDQPWAGARGEAIALGELPVNEASALRPDAPLTVEQQASGRAVDQAWASTRDSDSVASDLDEFAVAAGRIVARAIATAVRVVDPGAVVLGGGLGTSTGAYTNALVSRYEELTRGRPSPPPLHRARLGHRGGVIGAGLLAHRSAEQPER